MALADRDRILKQVPHPCQPTPHPLTGFPFGVTSAPNRVNASGQFHGPGNAPDIAIRERPDCFTMASLWQMAAGPQP